MSPDANRQLEALRAEVASLREDLQYALRRMLRDEDRDDLRQLLSLAEQLMGTKTWRASDLYTSALATKSAVELQAFLAARVTDGGGLRSFGRLLERGEGAVFAGLRLVRVGAPDRDGVLYTLNRVSSGQKPG